MHQSYDELLVAASTQLDNMIDDHRRLRNENSARKTSLQIYMERADSLTKKVSMLEDALLDIKCCETVEYAHSLAAKAVA